MISYVDFPWAASDSTTTLHVLQDPLNYVKHDGYRHLDLTVTTRSYTLATLLGWKPP